MTPFLHLHNVSDPEGLNSYCTRRLGMYLSDPSIVNNVYCKISRCPRQSSMYTCYIAAQMVDDSVIDTEVHHFFHHKAFDQALRNMVKKLPLQGLDIAS